MISSVVGKGVHTGVFQHPLSGGGPQGNYMLRADAAVGQLIGGGRYGKRTRVALCEAENSTKEKAAVGLQPRLQAVLGLEALTMGLLGLLILASLPPAL